MPIRALRWQRVVTALVAVVLLAVVVAIVAASEVVLPSGATWVLAAVCGAAACVLPIKLSVLVQRAGARSAAGMIAVALGRLALSAVLLAAGFVFFDREAHGALLLGFITCVVILPLLPFLQNRGARQAGAAIDPKETKREA